MKVALEPLGDRELQELLAQCGGSSASSFFDPASDPFEGLSTP